MDGFTVKVSVLHPRTTEDDLRKLFSPYGNVEITFTDEDEDQTHTAEVQLRDEETAAQAVKELKDARLHGQRFRIDTMRRRRKLQPPPSESPPSNRQP